MNKSMSRISMTMPLVLAVLLNALGPVKQAEASKLYTYEYTGETFDRIAAGVNFTTSDQITGTMTILDPVAGTLTGVGTGSGQVNITAVDFQASASGTPGVPTVKTSLATAFSPGTWEFTFDGALDITGWAMSFSGGGNITVQSFPRFNLNSNNSTTSLAGGFSQAEVTGFTRIGSWELVSVQPVPEPSSIAIAVFGLLPLGFYAWRRRT